MPMLARPPFNPSTSDELPNGATILKRWIIRTDTIGQIPRWLILGYWIKYGDIEYATWSLDPNGSTYWGHYFADLQSADDDFLHRCDRGF